MENNPLVTVNILSFNRKDDLSITLRKVFEQDYKNIEVIVVDNASSDGSPDMVRKEFPNVNLIRLGKNIGIAGWNEGFKAAQGEYVLVLDDDSYIEKEALEITIQEFRNDKNIACITFNVFDLTKRRFLQNNFSPFHKYDLNKFYWPVFIGCAAVFCLSKISDCNPMPTNYFLYQHEIPVSADIYSNGFKILFHKKIIAYHKFKYDYSIYKDSQCLKNNLLFINEYLPFYISAIYSLQCILYYLSRSIRKRWFKKYIRIILSINYLKRRIKIIPFSYFIELKKLHIFNFTFLSKLLKTKS
jgi:GT2 family glycosyltransferase